MAMTVHVIERLRYIGVSIYMDGLALNLIEAFICIDIMPAALAAPPPLHAPPSSQFLQVLERFASSPPAAFTFNL
jgi:hypothetical protein